MSAMTDYLRNKILDHVLNGVSYATPASLWLGLFTTETTPDGSGNEVSGGSYAREQMTFTSISFGSATNAADIFFPTATAPWYSIPYFGVFDAASGGNMLFYGKFNNAAFINTGNVYFIPTNSFIISLK